MNRIPNEGETNVPNSLLRDLESLIRESQTVGTVTNGDVIDVMATLYQFVGAQRSKPKPNGETE